MSMFLIETYSPRADDAGLRATVARARAAARGLSAEGVRVRWLRTTFVPEDETCFLLFEAPCAEAVGKVSQRASLGSVHIVEAREMTQ
jgi:Protein of unknown function (DUF4242)